MSFGLILKICLTAYVTTILVEFALIRRLQRFLIELVALVAVVVLALLVTNATTGRVAFGEGSTPAGTVGWMFLATLLGICARYIFYLQGNFSWIGMLKPISISPIVLLPLVGSVQSSGDLKAMQVICFAFLAFQNGFFWQAVLDSAKPRVPPVVPPRGQVQEPGE